MTTNTSFCVRNVSKTKSKPAEKKYRMMCFYPIENDMKNFRHFCKKKKKKDTHLRSSLSMVLHSTLQLLKSVSKVVDWNRQFMHRFCQTIHMTFYSSVECNQASKWTRRLS